MVVYKLKDYKAVLSLNRPMNSKLRLIAAMRFNDKKSDCNRVRHFRKPKNLHRNRGYALGEMKNFKTHHVSNGSRLF